MLRCTNFKNKILHRTKMFSAAQAEPAHPKAWRINLLLAVVTVRDLGR
jgi:hypothetical protein